MVYVVLVEADYDDAPDIVLFDDVDDANFYALDRVRRLNTRANISNGRGKPPGILHHYVYSARYSVLVYEREITPTYLNGKKHKGKERR